MPRKRGHKSTVFRGQTTGFWFVEKRSARSPCLLKGKHHRAPIASEVIARGVMLFGGKVAIPGGGKRIHEGSKVFCGEGNPATVFV